MTYDISSSYSEAVLSRFRAPGHAGRLPGLTAAAGSRERGCEIQFSLEAAAGRVRALRFQAYGCPHAIAAAELAAERLEGERLETLAAFRGLDLQEPLDVPPEKLGVLLIVEDALHALAARARADA